MFKLSNQILDAYDDINREGIKKLASVNPNIYMMTSDEVAKLSDTDYALSIITKKASKLNKFPVDSHDNTWLSNQYFEMNNCRMPKVAAQIAAYNIKTACGRFKIEPTPSVEGIAKEASSNVYFEEDMISKPMSRTKEVDLSKFAEVSKIANNETFATYVFSTPDHVKLASKYFDKYLDKMPLETRHKYAAAIQRRAGELGMEAQGGKVCKYASDFYSSHVDAHIRSRATLLDIADPKFRSALDKLASMKKDMEPTKFAQILHGFDKRAKLDQYYGGYLVNPYESTFAAQPDKYAGYRFKKAGMSLDGAAINDVATAKYAKIKEYFGPHVADEFKKDPVSIFESLPMDAKEMIAGIANGTL